MSCPLGERRVTAVILPNDLQEAAHEEPPRKHGWDVVASIKAMERGALCKSLRHQRLQRRELTARVIHRPGFADFTRELAQQVQIREPRLDHEDVRAFGYVSFG